MCGLNRAVASLPESSGDACILIDGSGVSRLGAPSAVHRDEQGQPEHAKVNDERRPMHVGGELLGVTHS